MPCFSVFAPPGGRSANIFGVPEPEQPVSVKKNHMESDIFGCKKDKTDSAPAK
jgi:Microtubule-Associated protein Jupiter